MELVNLKVELKADANEVMSVLLDHENLSRFFGARFSIIEPERCGQPSGGVGTVRRVTTMGNTFDEKVVALDQSTLSYQIIGKAPLNNHRGTIRLSSAMVNANVATVLHYQISGTSSNMLPTALIGWLLRRDITKAMAKLARYFDAD